MIRILAGVFILSVLAENLVHHFYFKRWVVSLILIAISVALYLMNIVLIKHYIHKCTQSY